MNDNAAPPDHELPRHEMPHRELTLRWDDPLALAAAGRRLSGRDFLAAVCEGRLPPPPVTQLVGFRLEAVGDGSATFAMTPSEAQFNPLGSVHGGILATLLDSAMGCAVHSTLPAGRGYTTLEIKVNYVRAVTLATGRVRAEGRALHVGRQAAIAEASLRDDNGKLYAQASTTCLIFDLPGATGAS